MQLNSQHKQLKMKRLINYCLSIYKAPNNMRDVGKRFSIILETVIIEAKQIGILRKARRLPHNFEAQHNQRSVRCRSLLPVSTS